MNLMRVSWMTVIVAWMLAGCRGGEQDIRPPAAVLTIDGVTQEAGIGSYCWQEKRLIGSTALCADMIGIPTPDQPLRAKVSSTAELVLPLSSTPSELLARIRPIRPGEAPESLPGSLWWQPDTSIVLSSHRIAVQTMSMPADAGRYLISVEARWPDFGDVVYGFLVELN